MNHNHDHLITLNCGLGRDSIAMLCLLVERELVVGGRKLGPEDLDAVIFADPGAEWEHTYAELAPVDRLCKAHGILFLPLLKPADEVWQANLREAGSRETPVWCQAEGMSVEEKARTGAYHRRLPIMDEYARNRKIAVTVSASCTDNHKVQPIRRCLNDLCLRRFGLNTREWSHRARAGLVPRHEVLLGIAADEASRAIDTGRPAYEQVRYPLVEMGLSKADEAPILARHGFGHVKKSGCVMCPYQGLAWFWVLRETDPARWAEAVAYERSAHEANPKMFVAGSYKQLLPEAVEAWRARNPDATVIEVLDKAYSRGCRTKEASDGSP